MTNALNKVRKMFPNVKQIVDAPESLTIPVEAIDCTKGRKKSPDRCALAQACIRHQIAEGAIIGMSTSYLIDKDTAYRFKTSPSLGREITSFDRHADFQPGDYTLSRMPETSKAPAQKKYAEKYKAERDRGHKRNGRKPHVTTNVRRLQAI